MTAQTLLCISVIIIIFILVFHDNSDVAIQRTENMNECTEIKSTGGFGAVDGEGTNMGLGCMGDNSSYWGTDKYGGGFGQGFGKYAHGSGYINPRNFPALVHRGFEPTVTPTPYLYSTYNDYQGPPLYIRFYYDDTLPSYNMWKPIYDRLKKELGTGQNPIYFIENNENITTTEGVMKVPMFIKTRNGVSRDYRGSPNYTDVKLWALAAE
jgi:hypothetical protein